MTTNLPRLHRRGLIEAGRGLRPQPGEDAFRAFTGAVSLKLILPRVFAEVNLSFRAFTGAVSLKRGISRKPLSAAGIPSAPSPARSH